MRAYESGKVIRAFYASVRSGQLVLGVIDQPDGFVAGRFEQSRVVNDGERNALMSTRACGGRRTRMRCRVCSK